MPTPQDLDLARDDALLQLRIGRSAHYYTILVAAALLFDAFLVLYLPPSSAYGPTALRRLYFLLFPLLGGVALSGFALAVKWETYQLWPWEGHFWVSVGSLIYNVLLGVLFLASVFHVGPTGGWGLLPWFYPLVLGGPAFALVGLGLTWSEWSHRKTMSVTAAVLPVPFGLVAYFFAVGSATGQNALGLSLATAAVLYLISGGFLHIISSGTRSHEREVITSGQSKIFQLAEEVQRREEALRFREATLIKREADAEDTEGSLRRQREALDLARMQSESMEAELAQRRTALQEAEQAHVAVAAETKTSRLTIQDRESDLVLREKELQGRLPRLAEREQAVVQKETEHRQRESELVRREQELERRTQGIPEGEANLERRRQELEQRTAEVLRRESEVMSREVGAIPGAAAPPRSANGSVEDREAKLAQLKITLDEQNLILGRKARQTDEAVKDLLRREQELAARESGVTARETALSRRETDAAERYDLGEQRRNSYETALRGYEDKIRQVEQRDAELGARRSEVERIGTALQQREAQSKEKEAQIGIQRTALERLQRVLAERQRALEAREDEVALRAQALGARTPAVPGAVEGPAAIPVPDLFAAPPGRKIKDRSATGTPRLDDLLSGGIPPRGHLLLVGDAFVGKEVVLYAFLAEGLKNGEPAIIVTTARSPEEIAEQIGLVSPQFHEYEQLGKVSWVDASNPGEGAPARGGSKARSVTTVKGPDDHAAILSAMVAAAKKAESNGSKGFRVGFLGLSNALGHGDEKSGAVFLQNFVGILKPRPALALYSLEAGAIPEAQVERILSRMDGAIRFKQEQNKTFLSVAGIGEVQTREWIECRATNRALVIGSFSLERIR